MKAFIGIPLGAWILGLAGQAGAAVLITDNFNNLGSGATLQTRTPDGTSFVNNVNGTGWSTITVLFSGNGSGGLSAVDSSNRNAFFDLGANYFVTNPGVYTLSVTMTTPAGQTGTSWVGLGFSPNNTFDQSFNGLGGGPFVLHRNTGAVLAFAGPNATNGSSSIATTAGTAQNFVITLNTALANWTMDTTINGVAVDLNGAAAGSTYTYGAGLNPAGLRYIGLAMAFNNDSATSQTVDNFSFTGPVPVPEPAAATLAAAAAGGLLLRRRRSQGS